MKPFNLQEALAGKPVVTRDGRKVTDVSHLPTANVYKVVGVIDGMLYSFDKDGRYNPNWADLPLNLFMASEKKRGWGVILKGGLSNNSLYLAGDIYPTEQAAIDDCGKCRGFIATVPIEWEE